MTSRREQVFHCEFEATTVHVSGHVRAWDSPEALELFAAELQGDGVRVPGTMAVTPIGQARASAKGLFRPAPRTPRVRRAG
jgi:hypothetical protein